MSRFHGDKELWLSGMRADGPALRVAAAEVDPAAGVPSRPQWTMTDLVHHLGSTYRWVGEHVGRGVTTQPERPLSAFLDDPIPSDVLTWWDEQFSAIMATLDALDVDAPAWNWAPQGNTAGFWHRRMALETAVNRWDAQMATGIADPIEAKLASDGVSEVLDTFLPGAHGAVTTRPSGLVALQATDVDHTWHVRLRGDAVALLDTDTLLGGEELHARAVAAGPASDLMLALHGRIGIDVLDVSGNEQLIQAVRVA